MARHNVIFGNDQAVKQQPQSYNYQSAPQASGQGGQQQSFSSGFGTAQQAPQQGQDLEALYARPAAGGHDTGRMSMRDALNAITATLGIIIVVAGAVGLLPALGGVVAGPGGEEAALRLTPVLLGIGIVGGLITGLVNAFKKTPSAAMTLAYAGFEGLLIGGISAMFERQFDGIVFQAVLGTLAVATTILVLFRAGILRTSPRLNKIFFVALIAYTLFLLVNIVTILISGDSLRDGLLGLLIGGIAVVLASYSLVMDFEDVQRATQAGVARNYAWRCAFGIAATMVWMYIEILRILAILRNN